ncbi:hypothetical protein FRX31_008786 [Thalictrum thalictroides]|uniref:Uncharacterized protein n=1 Tax=Thalictrum thalictroides TaxID=46969 RepID=A0A7J6WXJ5_THATH|nr:hypothetical protein FRX31_008786 [Thalictrum thalictroides]
MVAINGFSVYTSLSKMVLTTRKYNLPLVLEQRKGGSLMDSFQVVDGKPVSLAIFGDLDVENEVVMENVGNILDIILKMRAKAIYKSGAQGDDRGRIRRKIFVVSQLDHGKVKFSS